MKLYHRTDHAEAILRDGFRDGEGSYLTANIYRGVWFADSPLDENEGAWGSVVIEVDAGDSPLGEWEWVEEGKVPGMADTGVGGQCLAAPDRLTGGLSGGL
jgi:hypothetical protein